MVLVVRELVEEMVEILALVETLGLFLFKEMLNKLNRKLILNG
jgi:hypothetical protein